MSGLVPLESGSMPGTRIVSSAAVLSCAYLGWARVLVLVLRLVYER